MPNLYETHEGDKIAKVNGGFCGPKFDAEALSKGVRLEVWGSSFDDPGPDWCRFDLIAQDGTRIATHTEPGY